MPCNLPAASNCPQILDQSNLSLECLTVHTPDPIRIVLYDVAVKMLIEMKPFSECCSSFAA